MNLVKSLIGGIVIMVFATLIGVAQNAVRSDPIKLFPRIHKPNPRIQATPAARGAESSTPSRESEIDRAEDITDEELVEGEVSTERLRVVMEAGTPFIIDARGEGEFAEGHIPGALNIPYEKFIEYSGELNQVPEDVTVIVYCRSITCDLSDNLARELRLMGYERVLVYRGGWDEWTEAGFPSEIETPLE
jgi:rhodanese-related sulfurtransferase